MSRCYTPDVRPSTRRIRDRIVAGVLDVRLRGGCSTRRPAARRGAPHRLPDPDPRRAVDLSLGGRHRGRARDRGAEEDAQRRYGGVVPELPSRAHLELRPALLPRALEEAGSAAADLTAIGVTRAPGLVGSLVVGVAFAKALAYGLGVPVVGVNHIEAHLHAAALEHGDSPLPAV